MADKTVTRIYHAPAPQTWQALVGVIGEQRGWTTLGQDPSAGTITFNTGISMSSWSGQDMTAQVSDLGDGRSRIVLGGQIARRGLSTFQVASWGEKQRIAKKVIQRLDALLGAGT